MRQGDRIDWARVAELRGEVGADAFDEVVEMFLEEVEEVTERLAAAPDPGRLEMDLHFLKGSALNLGFAELASLCAALERAAGRGPDAMPDLRAVLGCYAESKSDFLAGLHEPG